MTTPADIKERSSRIGTEGIRMAVKIVLQRKRSTYVKLNSFEGQTEKGKDLCDFDILKTETIEFENAESLHLKPDLLSSCLRLLYSQRFVNVHEPS